MSLHLTDLGSTNGTYIRLRPRQVFKLWDGCKIIIGRHVLTHSAGVKLASGPGPVRAVTMPLSTLPKGETHGLLTWTAPGRSEPRELRLNEPIVIGRSAEKSRLVLADDDFVSPTEARIEFNVKLQQFTISDLQSANGVFVQIRLGVVLEDGDIFRLGEQLFGVIIS